MSEELHYRSATELAAMLRAKQVSAREVVTAHLERVELLNPRVNAIVTLTAEQALDAGAAQDELAARGEFAGPLHGLPVAHKDNHLTAGIRTTFGSPSRADFVPDTDDLVIERMKRAGVITLGKTNIPEFAAGGHTFNEVFGTTRNPYDLSVTAGGSSGGAAAALATGMHPLADGNDMGGSLRLPAGYCNVIGLRPSAGRVPVHPARRRLRRTVRAGPDGPHRRRHRAAAVGDGRPRPAFADLPGGARCDVRDGRGWLAGRPADRVLAGPRRGDPGGGRGAPPSVWAAAASCETHGAYVDEASPGLRRRRRVLPHPAGLAVRGHPRSGPRRQHCRPVRPSLYANMLAGRELTGPQVGRAMVLRTTLFHRMREFLEIYDALILPVAPLPAFDADLQYPAVVAGREQPDYLGWMRSVCHVTVTGHPVISMPAGFTAAGTPLGVQIVGRHRAERELLSIAKGFETATGYASRHPELG